MTPDELAHQIAQLLDQEADAKSDADEAKEWREILLSALEIEYTADAKNQWHYSRSKIMAKTDKRYKEATIDLNTKRRMANKFAAKVKGSDKIWETWRTKSANKRKEMGLV